MAACNESSGEVRQQLGVCMAHVYEHMDMGMGTVLTAPNTEVASKQFVTTVTRKGS